MTFLNKTLLSTCLLAGALCTSPLAERHSTESAASLEPAPIPTAPVDAGQAAHARAYPLPTHGLTLTPETCTNMADLLSQFSAVTGEALLYSNETKAQLEKRETGLRQSLTIAPEDVYATVQDILVANRIVLTDLSRTTPRMLWVESGESNRRSSLRENPKYVSQAHLAAYSRDSAIMITTVLNLPHCDTRVMSNAMRALVTDSNTMQIMAVSETHSFVLTGRGAAVNSMASLLYAMEEEAERAHKERMENRQEEPAEQASAKKTKK
jgi:hypothetical protein